MKTLLVYKSKTGFTKRYAEWIAKELGCEMKDYSDISKNSLDDVDLLIYGGGIHAGRIYNIKKIIKLAQEQKCKLVVFATGASPADLKDQIAKTWKNNKIDNSIPHFYMQSGLCYEKMSCSEKLLMKIFAQIMSSKKEKTKMESDMSHAISRSYDVSSKEYIKPLVKYVHKLNS